MSTYTNYNDISKTYDDGRYACGVGKMTFMVEGLLKKKAEDIHLLDAGCGTGNYSVGFLENGIGKITMMDASEGMLDAAKKKVEKYIERVVDVKHHKLPEMPFEDASFDVVTLILVIHHVDKPDWKSGEHLKNGIIENGIIENGIKEKAETFPGFRGIVKEAFRVLKPNGVVVIDHIFHANIDACWLSLCPKACEIFKSAFIPEDELFDVLKQNGFPDVSCLTRPGVTCLKKDVYSDPELLLDANWRRHASKWQFPEETGEINDLIKLIEEKKADGTLEEFAHEHNKKFRRVGFSITVFGQKSA